MCLYFNISNRCICGNTPASPLLLWPNSRLLPWRFLLGALLDLPSSQRLCLLAVWSLSPPVPVSLLTHCDSLKAGARVTLVLSVRGHSKPGCRDSSHCPWKALEGTERKRDSRLWRGGCLSWQCGRRWFFHMFLPPSLPPQHSPEERTLVWQRPQDSVYLSSFQGSRKHLPAQQSLDPVKGAPLSQGGSPSPAPPFPASSSLGYWKEGLGRGQLA